MTRGVPIHPSSKIQLDPVLSNPRAVSSSLSGLPAHRPYLYRDPSRLATQSIHSRVSGIREFI